MSNPVKKDHPIAHAVLAFLVTIAWLHYRSEPAEVHRFAQLAPPPKIVKAPVRALAEVRPPVPVGDAIDAKDMPRFRPATGWRYAYAFDRILVVHAVPGAAPVKEIEALDAHGMLWVDVLRADESAFEAVFVAEVAGAEVASLRVVLDAEGKSVMLTGRELKTDIEREHANTLKDLIAAWVFTLEVDTVGRFNARFEKLAQRDNLTVIQKQKLSYVSSGKAVPEIVRSTSLIEWDRARDLPLSVRGDESIRPGEGQSGPATDSKISLRFAGAGKSQLPEDSLSKLTSPESLARTEVSSAGSGIDAQNLASLEVSQHVARGP